MTSSPALFAELQRLEQELHHSGAPCAPARAEALLHPDFHEVGRSGLPYDRATVVRFLASLTQAPAVESFDFQVVPLAADAALLTYRSCSVAPDGARSLPAWRASVWVRTPAGWRLRYHQGTPATGDA